MSVHAASSIQSTPLIAAEADHLTVFQRTPNFTIPAHNVSMDPEYQRSVKKDYADFRARCAATGRNDALAYVSPKTGRAVSLSAGEPYRDRLLPLPGFLAGQGDGGRDHVGEGLRLTGFFLERFVFGPQDRPLPPPRRRLSERFPEPLVPPGEAQP